MRPGAVPASRRGSHALGQAVDRRRAVRSRAPLAADRGDIVTGWLVKILLTCAILGVILFDAISIGVAKMGVTDRADQAARAASTSWGTAHDQQAAFDAAWNDATEDGDENVIDPATFRVDADGTVHLTMRRTAPTLVVRLIGPIRDWANVRADGSGRVDP